MDTRIPPAWKQGDPISARRLNELQDIVQAVTHGPRETPTDGPRIIWVRMKQRLGPAADFADRDGVMQFVDLDTGKWADTNPEQEVKVSDPSEKMCIHEDAIVPCLGHRSGKLIPLRNGIRASAITLSSPLASGASTTVTLSDGTSVSGTNQTSQTLPAGRAVAIEDSYTGAVMITGAAAPGEGGGSEGGLRTFFGVTAGALRQIDGTVVVDGVEAFDNEAGEPTNPTVDNPYHFYGNNNSACHFTESPGRTGNGYTMEWVDPVASVVEGYVYDNFTTDADRFRMTVERAYQGNWPEHAGAQVSSMMVFNVPRTVDPNDRGAYLFEGEYGAVCRAELWPECPSGTLASLGVTFAYRAVWVECPEKSPVESESAHAFAAVAGGDLYSQGGQSSVAQAGAYFGG